MKTGVEIPYLFSHYLALFPPEQTSNGLFDETIDTHLYRAIDVNRQGRILVTVNDGLFYFLVSTEEIIQ